jgi:hypothetical protein
MSNFGGRLSQPKKIQLFLGISFFCQHNSTGGGFLILKQIIVYLTNLCVNWALFEWAYECQKKAQFTHERVEYKVVLFDKPLKAPNRLKSLKLA